MRKAIVLAAILLAGCASRGGPTPAQLEKLDALQAVVNEGIRNGKITPVEGRAIMANAKANMEAERARNRAIMLSGDDGFATYQPVGGGTFVRY